MDIHELVISLAKPEQRQQEPEEAPGREGSQEEEIGHHGPQCQKYEVIPQQIKRQARNQNRSSES